MASSPGAEGLNRFAGEAHDYLARTRGNLVFSPLSISTALSMALTGARGKTAGQITAVIHSPITASLLDSLTQAGNASGDQLLLAQALWVERAFPLLPDFTESLQSQFHAAPNQVDFSKNPDSARTAINQWTSEKTKGKIQELFAPGALDRSTRLVLTSAIYFNGKWQSRFKPEQTRSAPFHSSTGTTVETSFMNQTARFGYSETANAQVLEMPYAGGALAFDVILPKAGTPLATIEQAFRSDGLSAWFGQLQPKRVEVSLPKFRAESSFSLRPALSAMGMADAFSGSADFSGMDGRRDLTLSEVKHKAYIDVSEEGTEAAAATGGVVALTAFAPPPRFIADHPFLYLIRDTKSGAVLFAGRYEDAKSLK
jgi:serpin B